MENKGSPWLTALYEIQPGVIKNIIVYTEYTAFYLHFALQFWKNFKLDGNKNIKKATSAARAESRTLKQKKSIFFNNKNLFLITYLNINVIQTISHHLIQNTHSQRHPIL